MRIVVLTSSRADYGIYIPLLKKLKANSSFETKIVAFGTHLSPFHGFTLNEIINDGFEVNFTVDSLVAGESAEAISTSMGLTNLKFSSLWAKLKAETDLIICLGDRFEMFAAVSASIPFNIPIAHIHGGEETLGAIDNVFRHSITIMSNYHFTSTERYADRVKQLTGKSEDIYNVGALSLDNIDEIPLFTTQEFQEKFGVDLAVPTILVTFHPETVWPEKNAHHVNEIVKALNLPEMQVLITMPNADTAGNQIRAEFHRAIERNPLLFGVENLGTKGYFTAMKYCDFLLGNTSSGIIEAASFGKYVINLGERQKGRAFGENVLNIEVTADKIVDAIGTVKNMKYTGVNIYKKENSANEIIKVLTAMASNT